MLNHLVFVALFVKYNKKGRPCSSACPGPTGDNTFRFKSN